ncbi:aminoacyl-tRNA hydrolase [Corynebacterium testudinoris]|uniref:Peptidyl-tRNA hydrolase n=1 Tax=Corynebacterium testudinoris TaxID=136857 RepID=A0A0G3H8U1_9CORY|nr:aminoacyl-tRNA hydrolase [Corynebacterium testudinoris]MBX8995714.1 aminoacyl-tRNA hydrolase [Corynebacterium testudinoris]
MFNLFRRLRRPAATPPVDLTADWIVVGLGNPGARYAATRHNVGYMALDDLLAPGGDLLSPLPGTPAEVAPLNIDGHSVLAVRPTTYMNLSGEAIAPLAERLGIAADHIIVIHDELDLPAGKVRLKLGGNENGHNGLKSTTEHLGTRDYLRIRIGISRPPAGMPVPDYVLGTVDSGPELDSSIATAADAVRLIISEGMPKAQNVIHSR